MMNSSVKVTKSGHVVDIQKVRVLLTNGKEITGIINIAENNCQRLSEMFTKHPKCYIILCRCSNGQKVMFINKEHVVWATPVED